MVWIVWRMRVTCQLRAVRRHALMSLRNLHGVERNGRVLARGAVVCIARTMPSAARRGECVLVTGVAERKQRKRSVAAVRAGAGDRSRDSGTAHALPQQGSDGMMATVVVPPTRNPLPLIYRSSPPFFSRALPERRRSSPSG